MRHETPRGTREAGCSPKGERQGHQDQAPGKNGHDQTAIQPDRAEAERFLSALDPAATFWTFQTFDDDKERAKAFKKENRERKKKKLPPLKSPYVRVLHGTLDQHWNELVRLNTIGAGIFITVNETDRRGRETKNIVRVRALFSDLDGAPLDAVMQHKPPPNIVVESSAGKYHPYWPVDDVELARFPEYQKNLIRRFNADPAVFDLPRVMRLAGFVHQKGEPFRTRIHHLNGATPYHADDFGFLPEYVKPEDIGRGLHQEEPSAWQVLNTEALANLDNKTIFSKRSTRAISTGRSPISRRARLG
jgi:hypothetical protein